ncbi:MAG: glucosamine-6-phosphate deaminase [Candidatus Woesearchaeota archaeon]
MQIVKAKSYEELSKKAAMIVANQVMLKPTLSICFATGATPLGMYQELQQLREEHDIDFRKCVGFHLDEYWGIAPTHPQSYHTYLLQNVYTPLGFMLRNCHFLNSNAHNPKAEAARYEAIISKKGIDLAILGIGTNGHIAFNEPGTPKESKTRLVQLSKQTRKDNARFFGAMSKVPTHALTVGISTILRAKKIILLASGKTKAKAIQEMIEGPITPKCPASFLQLHPDVLVVVDQDAARNLTQPPLPERIGHYTIFTKYHFPKQKTILVISPHPDDSCIAVGGTIAMFATANTIHGAIMVTGHKAQIPNTTKEQRIKIRMQESNKEAAILGFTPHHLQLKYYDAPEKKESEQADKKKVARLLQQLKPDIIFLPQPQDTHPTHQYARAITLKALKQTGLQPELWNYEGPWSMFSHEQFNAVVFFPKEYFKKKLKAVAAHASQNTRTPYLLAASSLTTLRGALIPEQKLFGFGKQPVHLDPYIELYAIEQPTQKE